MQSYFGASRSGDGIPLLEDAHVGQGDVTKTLSVSDPLSQITLETSSPAPNRPNHSTITLQSGPLYGEEDLFMCGRCKQQFVDLQVFLRHKKGECVARHQQMQISQDHSLPTIQLPTIPSSHFQLERKSTEPFPNSTVLVTPSQGDRTQAVTLLTGPSQSTDECMESSNGINLTQKDKNLSCEESRDESTFLTNPVQQTGLSVNQASDSVLARSTESMLLHSNITVSASAGESIMLADDILTTSSQRQIDFTPELHLPRYHESEINQQQLNALGMSVLGNGNVASLLQQIPTQTFTPPQQQISLCNNQQQQQQVYIHIPTPSPADAQKMFAIQPRDGTSNYALGLNLSSINVTPLTLTTSPAIYTVQDHTLQSVQSHSTAENLSKEIPIAPKDGSVADSTPKRTRNIEPPQTSPRVNSKQKPSAKMHFCQYCSRGFPRTYDLEQHIRSHTGEKPFQCIVCGRAFAQKSNVKKHMETHKVWPKQAIDIMPELVIVPREENGKNYSQGGPKNSCTDASIATVLSSNSRSCPYCNQVLESYKERKSHMLRHKDKQVYKCVKEGCDQTFPELDDYVEHVKTHEGSMTYRCHHCHKLFDTLPNLGIHQYQAHLNEKSKNGKFGKQYRCKLCSCKFSHPELLQKHMNKETHNHRCAFCKKTFVCERYLRKHINCEHSDKPKKRYKCSECGKMMRSVYYLRTHMLIHTKETPFKCEVCPSAFNRKDNLIRHMVIHDPSKKFKCPFRETLGCQKEFNRPDKLKAHIICHNGIRAHKCSYCPKRYTRKSFKNAHEKTHTDEFRCKGCLKGFQNQKALDQHKCRPFSENAQKSADSRKKMGTIKNADRTTSIPDEPMYAIRSGSKRRYLRRDAARVKTNASKNSIGSQATSENDMPSQDEASTEESEVEIDVEAE